MGERVTPIIPGDSVPLYDDSDYRAGGGRKQKAKSHRRQDKRKRKDAGGRAAAKRRRRQNYKAPMINWAMIALILLIFSFVMALGSYIYLEVTPGGQLILARMGRDANADAYWSLGTEYLDQGYIARSISTYEQALSLEPQHPQLIDRLMMLAEAYEAASMQDDAEDIYVRIYSSLAPDSPLGYRNVIRLMLQQERLNEAVELMKIAAEKTGDDSFVKQRASLVPLAPTATVSAGRYLISQTVKFVSPQGYDIYYTTGNGPLPEQGILYDGPIMLGEGSHSFRAVCISTALMSDEMSVKYIVTLPSPPAPKANLSPSAYDGVRSVRLRDMEDDKKDLKKINTLYYTIDGTPPSIDSPRYVGEPIKLAGGRTNLRAVAVNGYGKVSNELNNIYTINKVPFKRYFNGEDEFSKFTLMKTTYEDFIKLYGQPISVEEIVDDAVSGSTTAAEFAFGYARFVQTDIGRLIYFIKTSDPGMSGPRGSKVGMDMTEVTALFRDMGQLPNDRGDRGIYYDIENGRAAYKVASDDPSSGELTYLATLFKEIAYTRNLVYDIIGGKVNSMTLSHIDKKVSNIL
ncbi:MAG: hypothetical protein GX781_01090 [Clostridiales bacterium]|nr:hypothetical protein [Clostridiales bacterium]